MTVKDKERERIYRKELRQSRIYAGVCVICSKPLLDTKGPTCSECLIKRRNYYLKRKEDRLSKGLCYYCGEVSVGSSDGKLRCDKCGQKIKIHTDKRRSNSKEKERLKSKERYKLLKQECYEAYGNKCECCGETEPAFLSFDHIHNDGAEHRKTVSSGATFFRFLKKQGFPKDNYRILCHNCNLGRQLNGGVCPHQRKE